MQISSKGIVLRNIKYSENSRIVSIYLKSEGMESFIIKASAKSKNRYKAFLFPLSLLEVTYDKKQKKNLYFPKELKFSYHYQTVTVDPVKSSVFLFLNEVIYKAIKEEEANDLLFTFLEDALITFDSFEKTPPIFHIEFLIEFSKHLGFYPQNNYQKGSFFDLSEGRFVTVSQRSAHYMDEQTSEIFNSLLKKDKEGITINKEQRADLILGLIDYYKIHLEGFSDLKSLSILEEIMS